MAYAPSNGISSRRIWPVGLNMSDCVGRIPSLAITAWICALAEVRSAASFARYRISSRNSRRIPFAAVLLLVFGLLAFVFGKTFTDFGHFVSVLIGFAIYPLVRGRSVDARARIPLYRPWAAAGVTSTRPQAPASTARR